MTTDRRYYGNRGGKRGNEERVKAIDESKFRGMEIMNGGGVWAFMYNLKSLSNETDDKMEDTFYGIEDSFNGLTHLLQCEDQHERPIRIQLSYQFIAKKRFIHLFDIIDDDMNVYRSLLNFLAEVSRSPEDLFADSTPKSNVRTRMDCLGRSSLSLMTETNAVAVFMMSTAKLLAGFEKEGFRDVDVEAICSFLKLCARLLNLTELRPDNGRFSLYSLICVYMDTKLDSLLEKIVTCPRKECFSESVVLLLRALFKYETTLLADMKADEDIQCSAFSEPMKMSARQYNKSLYQSDMVYLNEAPRTDPESGDESSDNEEKSGKEPQEEFAESSASDASFAMYKIANSFVPRGYCELADTLLISMSPTEQEAKEAVLDDYIWLHKTLARFCLEQPFMSIRSLMKTGTFSPIFHCVTDLTDYIKRAGQNESEAVPVPDRLMDSFLMLRELVRIFHHLRSKKGISYQLFCDLRAKLLYNNDITHLLVTALSAHRVVQWPKLVLNSLLGTCARLHELLEDDENYSIMSFSMLFVQRKMMVVYADVLSTFGENCNLLNNFVVLVLVETLRAGGTIRVLFVPELIAVFTEINDDVTLNLPTRLRSLIDETFSYYRELSTADPSDLMCLLYQGVYDEDRLMNNERLLYLCNFFLKHDKGKRDLPLAEILIDMSRVDVFLSSEVVLVNLFKLKLIEVRGLLRERKKLSDAQAEWASTKIETVAKAVEACKRLGLVGFLAWLQMLLLNICTTKLEILRGDLDPAARKPLFFHHIRFNRRVPILVHSPYVVSIVTNKQFRHLLSLLGMELDEENMYDVAVPASWTPKTMYNTAVVIGNYVLDLYPELNKLCELVTGVDGLGLTDDLMAEIDALDDRDLFATAEASERLMTFDWDVIIKAANGVPTGTTGDKARDDLASGQVGREKTAPAPQ